jgi:K+-sensing histidine kinase KdpD
MTQANQAKHANRSKEPGQPGQPAQAGQVSRGQAGGSSQTIQTPVDTAPIVALQPSAGGLSRSRRAAGLLILGLGLPLLTIVLVSVRSSLALTSMLLIYLLAVVVVAVIGGVVPALLAAVASFLLVNWFLTPPYYTLAVENRNATIDLVVFIVAAALVSVTVELGARNRGTAERNRIESRLISELSSAEISEASLVAVLEQVRGLFGMSTVALVDPSHADPALAMVGPPPSGRPSLTVEASDGLELLGYGPETFAEDRRLLGVLAAMASRAWQGQQLAEQAAQAHQLAETDRVRSALLTAVSHDLRTPLAGIKAAVSSLRQEDIAWTPEEQRELLGTIEDSSDRLGDLISNLLAMSRIQAGAISVHLSPVALDEVVARALLGSAAGLIVNVPEDLPLVRADAGLLERVVANLVDNARRFSPGDAPVLVHAELALPSPGPGGSDIQAGNGHPAGPPGMVRLRVTDHGPGIPPSQWDNIFVPFQRLGDHDAGVGLGLGLAIAAGFTEAMHAQLMPSETPGGGLTMTITLPRAP